jgi:O-antigen ligase
MAALPNTPQRASESFLPRLFAALLGAFFGLSLLKFGNPPILMASVSVPTNAWEFVFNQSWPIAWSYGALLVITVAGVRVARWRLPAPWWLAALPLGWLLWQCLAAGQSVRPNLTGPTVAHFAACVVCFYLGLLGLSRVRHLTAFWLGLLAGFLVVLAVGWEQHFWGLEDTRRYLFTYIYHDPKDVPPEYLKRIQSNRVFSTLFYANTLAGALLLLLPPLLAFLGGLRRQFTLGARVFLLGGVTVGALGCLFWSGSKGGWLLLLLLGLLALLRLRFSKRLKLALLLVVLVGGLAGFFVKYAAFFHKGAPSVGARFGYWSAASQIAIQHPLWGTGPGTFAVPYAQIKRPEWEMARLTHNDYLEQACDSGLPGFALFTGFIVAALTVAFKRLPAADWQSFALWLGVLGFALQSLFEFGLYVPALAWPAFAFLGYLVGQDPPVPTQSSPVGPAAKPAPAPQ